jgi:hypothetical protein
MKPSLHPCPNCQGKGTTTRLVAPRYVCVIDIKCSLCQGSGQATRGQIREWNNMRREAARVAPF